MSHDSMSEWLGGSRVRTPRMCIVSALAAARTCHLKNSRPSLFSTPFPLKSLPPFSTPAKFQSLCLFLFPFLCVLRLDWRERWMVLEMGKWRKQWSMRNLIHMAIPMLKKSKMILLVRVCTSSYLFPPLLSSCLILIITSMESIPNRKTRRKVEMGKEEKFSSVWHFSWANRSMKNGRFRVSSRNLDSPSFLGRKKPFFFHWRRKP